MFPGIADRMGNEITKLAPSSMKIKGAPLNGSTDGLIGAKEWPDIVAVATSWYGSFDML